MGICSVFCKDNIKIIDFVEERISTKNLHEAQDPGKNSLKNYFNAKHNQMLPTIREVYHKALNGNPLKLSFVNDKIVQRQGKFISVVLRYCPNLEILNLRSNSLGNAGALYLSTVFCHTTHLVQLTIEDNQIKGPGFKKLFSTLHYLTGLQILSFSHNTLGDSAFELANALKYLNNLEEVHLDVMEITSSDFNIFSLQLSDCKKLKKLNLGYNKLDSSCLAALKQLFNSLPLLEDCMLSEIEIGEEDIDRLIISYIDLNIKV